MDYIWLILAWLVYLTIHSLLASVSIKKFFYAMGISRRNYRLLYNFIAVITLIPVILISISVPKVFLIAPGNFLKIGGLIMAGYGVLLGKIAFRSYNTRAFLGLGDMKAEENFSTKGVLKIIRHPLYSASILIIVGYFLFHPTYASAISATLLILYIFIGIQLEERKLIRQFGDQYIEYKKNTPILIPKFRK